MKKKLFLFITCVAMVLSLAGCQKDAVSNEADPGNHTTTNTKDTVIRVAWWGNQVRNERTDGALKVYAGENPGVVFQNEFTDWGGYWDKLATQSAGNELPDIVQMDYKYLMQYAKNNLLADLTPYIENGTLNLDDASENIVKSGVIDGKMYAVCMGINSPALVYNKKAVAGVEIKDNMTLGEFIQVSRAVHEKTGMKTNIAYGSGDIYIEFFLRDKGYVLFEDSKLGVPDEAPLVDFFQLYKDAMDEGWHVDPSLFVEATPGSVETDPITNGKSWVYFGYSNQLSAIKSSTNEGIELEVTTWPAQNAEKANYLKPGQFFSITSDCQDVEAAVKVLDFLTNSVAANEILLAERGVPISSVVADTIKPKLDEVNQEIFDYINVVDKKSSPINPASSEGAGEIQKLIDSLVEQVCYGEKTPEDAGKELFEQGNRILGKKEK